MSDIAALLAGGLVVACAIVGLIFLRYWKASRDGFFLFFAFAFWLQAAQWLYSGLSSPQDEYLPLAYLLRLAAYGLIATAIVRKNLKASPPTE
jgi:uncharacterized membrane protein YfhO